MTGSRPRVAHVIDSLAGSGGAENRLVDEVLALDGRFDQTVVRLFERDHLAARLIDAGIPVVALGGRAAHAGRRWPRTAHHLTGTLRELRPDVVHTSLVTANLVGQLAGARLGVPVVSTFNRSGDADTLRTLAPGTTSWKARAMQAVARVAARRGDVIYRAVGDHVRSTNCAQMRLPLDRAVVVRRGVPVDDATPPGGRHAGRTALGLPAESPLFVNVARLVPEKAQHLLVEAFAAVRSEVPDAHLAIAGAAGPAEGRVTAAIARAGLGDAVSLLGFRPDAREVVAVADVFAFSSLSEGSPGAVVEALVQGTPVAAFAIDPVTELTEGDRHAWLAEPGDPAGLAAAMLDAHRSGADHRAATRQWAVDTYSIEAVARQLGDLLQSRIERARRYHDRDREPTEVR